MLQLGLIEPSERPDLYLDIEEDINLEDPADVLMLTIPKGPALHAVIRPWVEMSGRKVSTSSPKWEKWEDIQVASFKTKIFLQMAELIKAAQRDMEDLDIEMDTVRVHLKQDYPMIVELLGYYNAEDRPYMRVIIAPKDQAKKG